MKIIRFLALTGLAGCATMAGGPQPAEARLGRASLAVVMTDGTTCRGDLAGPAPWQGQLAACGLAYRVTPQGGDSPVRLAFDAMIAAIRAGDLVAPMADIVLSDAAGRVFRFASPVPLEP